MDDERGLSAKKAAKYVGLGMTTFKSYVKTGEAPSPVKFPPHRSSAPNRSTRAARRQIWLREDLDAWLDRLAGKHPHATEITGWE